MEHLRLRVLWIGTCLDHPSGAGCPQRTPSCLLRVNAELNSRRTKVTAQNVSIPHRSALAERLEDQIRRSIASQELNAPLGPAAAPSNFNLKAFQPTNPVRDRTVNGDCR